MSKICIKCGTELEDNAIFCDECGVKQTPIENKTVEPTRPIQAQSGVKDTKKKQSGMGIASFILGLLGVLTFGVLYVPEILGIIFGILGRRDTTKKTGLATAGLVLSFLAAAMWFI